MNPLPLKNVLLVSKLTSHVSRKLKKKQPPPNQLLILYYRTMGKEPGRFQRLYKKSINFLEYGLFSLDLDDLPPSRSRLIHLLRILVLVWRGVTRNRLQLRASALTFYTLMALVPILGLAFAIAKGFGLEDRFNAYIIEHLEAYPEAANRLLFFTRQLLERTATGLIAGIGAIMLLWSVVKVFSNIERSFNTIWQVNHPRSWVRKVSDYISMMLIAPLVLLAASSANVYLRTLLNRPDVQTTIIGVVQPYVEWLLKIAPTILVVLVFFLMYLVMPNTKVKVGPAAVSGLVAGVLFMIVQWGYLYFQFGVSKYNAIYGSFAAIPLFLIFTKLSWVITLLGAELSYAMQNAYLYEYELETRELSHKRRQELSLLLLTTIVKRFHAGETPLATEDLAQKHNLPLRLTRTLLQWMEESGLIIRVLSKDDRAELYQPARSLAFYTVGQVLAMYKVSGLTIDAKGHALQAIEKLSEDHLNTLKNDATLIYDLANSPETKK